MSHQYHPVCDCPRCKRETARRARQTATDPRKARKPRRHADHETQQGRYIDCGPGSWDDQTNPDY